jgi:maleate isomerase
MPRGSAPTVALGMITPSSNTVLEPMTYAMLGDLNGVSAHFARIPVTEITPRQTASAQFDDGPMLHAASLLADARVRTIAWNGTSASWLGFARDDELCRVIEDATGIPATTSVIGINKALATLGARRIAIVTPYLAAIQERIVANYESAGFAVVAERHLDDPGNHSFALHGEDRIAGLIREVAADQPQAIAVVCTNFRGTRIAAGLEQELGIPVIDSIAATLWHSLALAGVASTGLEGRGSLFRLTTA